MSFVPANVVCTIYVLLMVQNLQAHYFIFTPNNEIESQGSATVNDKSYEYELTSDSPMDSLHKNGKFTFLTSYD